MSSSGQVQQKLLKGIVIGGLCSIISLDMSELVSTCLDPVVKRINRAFPPTTGANIGRAPFTTMSDGDTDGGDGGDDDDGEVGKNGQVEKDRRKKKARKLLYKRILRILLFTGLAYFIVAHLMQPSLKK